MPILILGPQRPQSNVAQALQAHGATGRVALITAGWRWDEGEIDELMGAMGQDVHHLPLYHWFEQVMNADSALSSAYSERQSRITAYKELYRIRMNSALAAVADLRNAVDTPHDLKAEELSRALVELRRIDEQVLRSLGDIRAQFPEVARPWEIPGARRRHNEVAAVLKKCSAIVIAGGHVAVLRNRLLFFGFEKLLAERLKEGTPIATWSAGAMALGRRIVLFYDDPPEGSGNAEVLDSGLNLTGDLLVFPHAGRRLNTDDRDRIANLSQRFAPSTCIGLEAGAWLEQRDGRWVSRGQAHSAIAFGTDGTTVAVETAQ